jgi:SAM-dependent methyltransferase
MVDSIEPDYFGVRRFRREVPQKFLGYPLTTDPDGWICDRLLPQTNRVLEVGAGECPFLPKLQARNFNGVFKTMDIDRSQRFDYYSLDDVEGVFDAVIMREVIEHLPRPIFYAYLKKILAIIDPGGVLVITTPNPWAGGWYFCDYTHVSPWPPGDLYSILRWFGFSRVELCRTIWPSRYLWLKRLYWGVHSRFYDIDFAGGYVAVATK